MQVESIGWLIIILFLVAAVIVLLARLRTHRSNSNAHLRYQDYQQRYEKAVWAGATVISLRGANQILNNQASMRVELRLQVQPPGGETYEALTTWRVPANMLTALQPGQHVSVRIDAQDSLRIYPNLSGAHYWVT